MKYLIGFLIICLILLLLILLRSRQEMSHFRVVRYEVRDSLLPAVFLHKKIVFLSDLHDHVYGQNNDTLIRAIDEIRPDLICIGGDMMVVKQWSNGEFDVILQLLDALADRYPIVYADGNHEQRMKTFSEEYPGWYDRFSGELAKRDVEYLRNETRILSVQEDGTLVIRPYGEMKAYENDILVSGLSLEMEYYRKQFFVRKLKLPEHYLQDRVPMIKDPRFHIVLAHTPLYMEQYVADGGNLVLSGHFHGGCMRLPKIGAVVSPQLQLFPKYAWGYKKKGKSHVIVSAGLGTHSVNIRVNDPPELVVIELLPE